MSVQGWHHADGEESERDMLVDWQQNQKGMLLPHASFPMLVCSDIYMGGLYQPEPLEDAVRNVGAIQSPLQYCLLILQCQLTMISFC